MWFKESGRFNAFMRLLTWPRSALAFRNAVDDLIEKRRQADPAGFAAEMIEAYRLDADKGGE